MIIANKLDDKVESLAYLIQLFLLAMMGEYGKLVGAPYSYLVGVVESFFFNLINNSPFPKNLRLPPHVWANFFMYGLHPNNYSVDYPYNGVVVDYIGAFPELDAGRHPPAGPPVGVDYIGACKITCMYLFYNNALGLYYLKQNQRGELTLSPTCVIEESTIIVPGPSLRNGLLEEDIDAYLANGGRLTIKQI